MAVGLSVPTAMPAPLPRGGLHAVVLLLVAVLLPAASGLIETGVPISITPGFNYYDSSDQPFGFLAGGTFTLTVQNYGKPDKFNPMYFLYCSNTEVRNLGSDTSTPGCGAHATNTTSQFCSFGKVSTDTDPVSISGTLLFSGTYSLWIYSCSAKGDTATVDFTAINPDGNHLSSQQINLPMIYASYLGFWGLLFLFWTYNYLSYRKQSITLHSLIQAVIFSKMIYLVVVFLTWYFRSQYGDPSLLYRALNVISLFFFQELLLHAITLIGRGWCIIKPTLTKHENRLTFAVSLSTSIGIMFFNIFQSYLLVVIIVMYVLFVRFIHLNVNSVLYNLETHMSNASHLVSHNLVPLYTASIVNKCRLLKIVQRSMSVYIFALILTIIGTRFFLSAQGWVEVMLLEAYDFLFLLTLAHSLRLRDFSSYTRLAERLTAVEEESRRQSVEKNLNYVACELPGSTADSCRIAFGTREQMGGAEDASEGRQSESSSRMSA